MFLSLLIAALLVRVGNQHARSTQLFLPVTPVSAVPCDQRLKTTCKSLSLLVEPVAKSDIVPRPSVNLFSINRVKSTFTLILIHNYFFTDFIFTIIF